MFNEKSSNVQQTTEDVQRLLKQIESEHEKATKLEKELEHEKTVLEERLQVSFPFLLLLQSNRIELNRFICFRVRREC